MKKRNAILHTAVAAAMLAMAGTASAGTIATTFKTFASEVFGTGSNATAIVPPPVTYQFGVPVAAAQAVTVYVSLSGGAKFVAAPATTDLACRDANNTAIVTGAAALSTDSTFISFQVTPPAGFSTANVCTYTFPATGVNNAAAALGTSGGVINATLTIDGGTASTAAVPTGGTNLDAGGTHTGPIAQSAAAITGRYIASSAFPFTPTGGTATGTAETKRIDVTTTPTATKFTTGANGAAVTAVNLGALLFSETAGLQVDAGGAADYTIAGKGAATGLTGVITGNFSAAAAQGANTGVFLATDLACTAGIAAGTITLNTAKTEATLAGGTLPTVNVPNYVCMTIPAANTTTIVPTAYSATAKLAKTAATELSTDVASSSLLATQLNGTTRTVRSYIPVATVGYTSFVRVMNTGSVAAPVSAEFVNEDGTVSASGVVIANLPAGGSKTLTSAEIETAMGVAPAATVRPRLRLSAPTNALEAQSFFLTNANGNFSDATGAQ